MLLSIGSGGALVPPARPSNAAYGASYGTAVSLDEQCWKSSLFWEQLEQLIPGLHTEPQLERFRGFVSNLRTEPPGQTVTLPTGQELLTQYTFPGLQDGVEREPFPEQPEWTAALERLAPIAQAELACVLNAHPTLDDDAPAPDGDDDDAAAEEVWNRAAWFGWQFLSLRDAKRLAPRTIGALRDSGLPYAHRFVGVARQRPHCRGTLHSDQRNYLLSTLVGLAVPEGACGLVVERGAAAGAGAERRLLRDGAALVLDNTFPHYVYNDANAERFVLMVETCAALGRPHKSLEPSSSLRYAPALRARRYHPALTALERRALAALFALKDRFTVLTLRSCPWGFSEEELMHAIQAKEVGKLEFWRDLAYGL